MSSAARHLMRLLPINMDDKTFLEPRVKNVLGRHGLEHLTEKTLAACRIYLGLHEVQPEDYAATGNSRAGGHPDLPESWPFPVEDGKFINFLAQINLSELPSDLGLLPPNGWLYFFSGGYDGPHRCLYYDGPATSLVRRPPPDGMPSHGEAFYFHVLPGAKLTFGRSVAYDRVQLADLFGWESEIQGELCGIALYNTGLMTDFEDPYGLYLGMNGLGRLANRERLLDPLLDETKFLEIRESILHEIDGRLADPASRASWSTRT